ncbi:nitrogen fixation protein NifQ [Azoarcus sp. TTM-91]|uniref:nitrogen fixation protein NifQ n=1 Tax=Azoarcus sp. TTM-91 TaxID=2691581 RepID=UPI00145C460A|nr:nitrogen fixation protein NifQ [Azoarcus sp. TTM-91]NMG35416.1 nitrogen fixation protein NifQ [Azoarcus sp. TTM-91]
MLAPLSHRPSPARVALHAHLMRHAAGTPNDEFLAHLIAGWTLGDGVLPSDLGLGPARFARLMARHFPGLAWQPKTDFAPALTLYPEFEDLVRFIGCHADDVAESADDMAIVLATGCMGSDHLWQDLGLPSRRELSQLIAINFPELAAANTRDMKWKKFLYRELCQREGIYVCTSPSCEACVDFAACFGPEE